MIALADPLGLIEPGVIGTLLNDGCGVPVAKAEAVYVRHKPEQSTVVAIEFTTVDGVAGRAYAHWTADPARADQVYTKAMGLRPRPTPWGAGVHRADGQTVVYMFPNDPRLRRMRWYVTPRKLKRSLNGIAGPISGNSTVTILRYKPERRVVAKIELLSRTGDATPLLLRYSTDREQARLAPLATHLRDHGVRTPAPITQLEDGAVSVDEFVPGEQLREIIEQGLSPQIAPCLLQLHAVEPPGIPRRSVALEFARAESGLVGLGSWHPAAAALAGEVAVELSRSAPLEDGRLALLHGDLHSKNVLIDLSKGLEPTFVDLERAGVGSAAIDLGCYCAHSLAMTIRQPDLAPAAVAHAEATIETYRQTTPLPGLSWHTAVGLIDQALLVARHLESGWEDKSLELLEMARAIASKGDLEL